MAIEIEKQFSVGAAPDRVWAFLTDPHQVAACLPGAAVAEQMDEQTYAGSMKMKVGPVATSYKGKVRFERLDQAMWTAELTASGQDVRGKGGAEMRMTSQLAPLPDGQTEVTVKSEVKVSGILAQLGRGMIVDVSDQMFEAFTGAMRARLEDDQGEGAPEGERPEAEAAEALDVVSLGAAATRRAAGRLLRRPGFWAAAVVVFVILFWLLRT